MTFAAAFAVPRFDLAVSFLVSFALYSGLALALSRAGIFDFYNILFDADTNARLLIIAHGWGDYGLVHPLFRFVFSVPIRATAELASRLGLAGAPPVDIRTSLSLFAVPACGAAGVTLFMLLLRAAGLSRGHAALGTIFYATSFSTALLSSIPEHFAVSGALLVLLLLVLLQVLRGSRTLAALAPVGAALVGVTLSNAVLFALADLIARARQPTTWPRTILAAALRTTALVATVLLLAVGLSALDPPPARSGGALQDTGAFVTTFLRTDQASVLEFAARFPFILAKSVLAVPPDTVANSVPVQAAAGVRQLTFQARPVSSRDWAVCLVVWALLAGGMRGMATQDAAMRRVLLFIGATVAWNWAFHAVFGNEIFLYSQHWQAGVVLVILGALAGNAAFIFRKLYPPMLVMLVGVNLLMLSRVIMAAEGALPAR